MALAVAVIILMCGYASAQFPYFGKCPSPDVQENFDMKKFEGKWYEIERTMSLLQIGSSCTYTNFSDSGYGDGSYEVINEGISPLIDQALNFMFNVVTVLVNQELFVNVLPHVLHSSTENFELIMQFLVHNDGGFIEHEVLNKRKLRKSVRLIATVPDKSEPAKMELRLSDLSLQGSYWVLATDYDNYAIIWSCNHVWLTLKYARTENLWVHSRNRFLTKEAQEEVIQKLKEIKYIKVKKLLRQVSQDNCDDDTSSEDGTNETEK